MRKLILAMILSLGIISVAPCAQIDNSNYFVAAVDTTEENAPAEETPVAPAEETPVAPAEETPVAPAEDASEEAGNPWINLVWSGVALVIGLLAGTVSLAGKLGIKKLEKKLGFDIPDAAEEIAEGYLTKAINWTENWAKEQANKPVSEDKMAQTIKYAMEKAAENEMVRKKIEEKGKAIVEKLLKSNDTPAEATPKA